MSIRGYELLGWTNQRIDRLTAMVADGSSSSEIAAEFGVTRNSVIGKCSRLGLRLKGVGGNNKGRKPKARADLLLARIERKQKAKKAAPLLLRMRPQKPAHYLDAAEATDLPHDESAFAVTLDQLEPHHCRFPLGDPLTPEYRYCGAKKWPDRPYCGRHCRLSFVSPSARRASSEAEREQRARTARANMKASFV